MGNLENLIKKPKSVVKENQGRFEKFNLKENPFPPEPFVNKESKDIRVNGKIYEMAIRKREFKSFLENFIKQSRNEANHLRVCYLVDKSYVGRGNGKSAFLVNMQDFINDDFTLDSSNQVNKCFATYLTPESGGRTKSFIQLTDLIFKSFINIHIIEKSLITIFLEAINSCRPNFNLTPFLGNYEELRNNLYNHAWYKDNDIDIDELRNYIKDIDSLKYFPNDLDFLNNHSMFPRLPKEKDFINYFEQLKKGELKLEFIFTHLVNLFLAAGFNGAYIFIDDFERIPDFQSARQKRDFSLELRTCLFDGVYKNSKIGFYTFLLALHAGVPRLISDAWNNSGMENRAPIFAQIPSKHIISFDKLTPSNTRLLLTKYLSEYRIKDLKQENDLFPFSDDIVKSISEKSELNAARILKIAFELLEKASVDEKVTKIDKDFFENVMSKYEFEESPSKKVSLLETTDLELKSLK